MEEGRREEEEEDGDGQDDNGRQGEIEDGDPLTLLLTASHARLRGR